MKKTILLAAAATIIATGARGEVLTPEQALARVATETEATPAMRRAASNASAMTLVKTLDRDGMNAVYCFNNRGGGFLIVSADDLAEPVLGYSDAGSVDATSMPENMRAWLAGYADEIAAARAAGAVAGPKSISLRAPSRADIAPIVKTKWNQGAPYNNMCPTVGNARCVTGCVATATAQILKVHGYPVNGEGRPSYQWNGTQLSYNFATANFDWANMLDVYDETATAVQKNAVANLMFACGVACEMNYGVNASGANTYYAAKGMIDYFSYDPGIKVLERNYYPMNEWSQIVYDELAAGRPVQYGGSSSEGGHSFVCDGYRSGDYFHFNWGWGGVSDGYFKLNALDPESQGIGGSGAGYNQGQDIIIGIRPVTEESEAAVNFICDGSFGTEEPSYANSGVNVKFVFADANKSGIYNMSLRQVKGQLGVKLTDAQGNVSYAVSQSATTINFMGGFSAYYVNASQFPKTGIYTVTPAVRVNGEWYDAPVPMDYVRSLKLTASGTTLDFEPINPDVKLTQNDLQATSPIYTTGYCHITATISNTGTDEFYGTIVPLLLTVNGTSPSVAAAGADQIIDVAGGGSYNFSAVVTFSNVDPGNYYVCLATVEGTSATPIGGLVPVTVVEGSSSAQASVAVSIDGKAASYETPTTVSSSGAVFSYTLRCTSGNLSGIFGGNIFYDNTTMVKATSQEFVNIGAGQTATVSSSLSLEDLEENHDYMFVAWDNSNNRQMGNPVRFRVVKTPSGIEVTEVAATTVHPAVTPDVFTVEAQAAIEDVTLYNASGMAVATQRGDGSTGMTVAVESLPAGTYIVVVTCGDGSRTTHRIVKK